MQIKDLFDILDPTAWPQRPLTKVFTMSNFALENATPEEIRQTIFKKVVDWAGSHLDQIDTMVVERFNDIDEKTLATVPAIQLRFTLKNPNVG